jgi:hypothetical protein
LSGGKGINPEWKERIKKGWMGRERRDEGKEGGKEGKTNRNESRFVTCCCAIRKNINQFVCQAENFTSCFTKKIA